MSANLENSAVVTDWKISVFIPIPKKINPKECSDYHRIGLISHDSKVMLKIFQDRLQQYMSQKLPHVQAGFQRDQIANIHRIMEKTREFQKKHLLTLRSLCLSLWLCGWQQTVENSLKRHGNSRPLYLPAEKRACRLRSSSRTGHETTDRFKIGKGVCQGYILSPWLFQLICRVKVKVLVAQLCWLFVTQWTVAH